MWKKCILLLSDVVGFGLYLILGPVFSATKNTCGTDVYSCYGMYVFFGLVAVLAFGFVNMEHSEISFLRMSTFKMIIVATIVFVMFAFTGGVFKWVM